MEKPKSMRVYTVREFKRKGSDETEQSWTAIGAAFPNKKDDGFTIRLDALPLDGKLVVRPPKDDADEAQDSRDAAGAHAAA
jgi:hypothetical protein